MTKTTSEVSEETAKRGIMGCPVSNSRDICNDHHLEARNFWQNVPHPELGESLTYCGPFVQLSEAAMTVRRRAPLIGEHNREVYEKELGIGREALILLKQAGVV
jgi:crotonobetainyl-CoA:carnitine CoA-transferase CaiB-like acyl-CoA transferase